MELLHKPSVPSLSALPTDPVLGEVCLYQNRLHIYTGATTGWRAPLYELVDGDVPSSIARDLEVALAVADEASARDLAIDVHASDTTAVHGIADTAQLVLTNDIRMSDKRVPTDGSVGTPQLADGAVTPVKLSFDPATQAELDAESALRAAATATRVAKAGDTMTGELTVPDVAISGLTGSNLASRYVGATAAGAPTTGAFAVGDFVVDRSGSMYVCTGAGSPGSWIEVGTRTGEIANFARSGTLVVTAGKGRFRMPYAGTIIGVSAIVDTAPTGAAIVIDVNKNGTTIFTTQANRPQIAAGTTTAAEVTNMNVTALAAGDYLTVDIDQVGSTVAGADLGVFVRYRP